METQRHSLSWVCWALFLLLGLAMPPATAQALSYREAVLRAVDAFNQRSLEANLYRLLDLDQEPEGDTNPNIPKPVSFTVKETVCPRTSQQPPEQCDFKENGVVQQCTGTITLDEENGHLDIKCAEFQGVKFRGLRKLGRKIGRGIKKIGRGIGNIFKSRPFSPEIHIHF